MDGEELLEWCREHGLIDVREVEGERAIALTDLGMELQKFLGWITLMLMQEGQSLMEIVAERRARNN